jgi:NADH-ubiquinone oxidoreductase complex I, 21 kDa subunit
MPIYSKPRYPVVDPDPSLGKTVGNFNGSDMFNVFAFTGAGTMFGFFGSRMQLRGRNAGFLAGVGALAGIMYASQSSMQRLMGLEENSSEVARMGVASSEVMAKYNLKAPIPNVELIDSPAPKSEH